MQHYSYALNLRIWHAALDPDSVSRTLGIEPQMAWRTGDPRMTPKGTPLMGLRNEGYWSADPFGYGWQSSADALIEDALDELIAFLEPHRDFLLGISEGGIVRIWISSQSIRNYALELPPHMLIRLGALGATLVHDVFQGAE